MTTVTILASGFRFVRRTGWCHTSHDGSVHFYFRKYSHGFAACLILKDSFLVEGETCKALSRQSESALFEVEEDDCAP